MTLPASADANGDDGKPEQETTNSPEATNPAASSAARAADKSTNAGAEEEPAPAAVAEAAESSAMPMVKGEEERVQETEAGPAESNADSVDELLGVSTETEIDGVSVIVASAKPAVREKDATAVDERCDEAIEVAGDTHSVDDIPGVTGGNELLAIEKIDPVVQIKRAGDGEGEDEDEDEEGEDEEGKDEEDEDEEGEDEEGEDEDEDEDEGEDEGEGKEDHGKEDHGKEQDDQGKEPGDQDENEEQDDVEKDFDPPVLAEMAMDDAAPATELANTESASDAVIETVQEGGHSATDKAADSSAPVGAPADVVGDGFPRSDDVYGVVDDSIHCEREAVQVLPESTPDEAAVGVITPEPEVDSGESFREGEITRRSC